MNYLDFIILLLLGIAAWRGLNKGLIIELFTFLALFFGLYGGIHFSDFASRWLIEDVGVTSKYTPVIAFTVTFLAIGAMVYFAGKALEKAVQAAQLSSLNKLGGVLFSVVKMIFFIGGGIILIQSYDERTDILDEEIKQESLLFYPIETITEQTIPAFTQSTIFLKNALHNKDLLNPDNE